VAHAGKDLISHLVRGLQYDKEVREFLASVHPAAQKAQELTLYYWFYYGIVGLLRSTELKQSHEIVLGGVPLDAPVARLKKGKWNAPEGPFQTTDLLGKWGPQWGEFHSNFDPQSGYRITHADTGTRAGMAFRSGTLGETGLDVAGRMLVAEVVAAYEGRGKPPFRVFSCEIHAFHRDEGSDRRIHMCRDSQPYTFPYNQVMTVRIPLSVLPPRRKGEPQLLNGLAFAGVRTALGYWPRNATLTVLGLRLEPRPGGMLATAAPSVQPKAANLLSQWVPMNPVPDGSPLLGVAHDPKWGLALRPARPRGTPVLSKCGSDLLAPVYIPKESQLEVEAYNTSSREAQFTLDVVNIVDRGGKAEGTSLVGLGAIKLRPGRTKVRVPLTGHGYAHYLAVGTKDDSIILKSVKVVAKQPRK
jgi:hypothetical protein